MASSDTELGATECPVCHEYYKEPKILPCAHLLCRTCLLNSMKTNKLRQCPLCHCAIVDHHNPAVRSCDDVADLLPTDDAMSEMVDNIRIFNQARVCHVHKTVNAKSFCLHCGLMLCPSCVEAHLAVPATSCHTLEDLEKLTLESLTSHRQSPCSVHPEKATELFCSTHGILICQLCAFSKHRACQEVTCISEMFEKYKQSLSEMEKELRAMEDALNRVIADMEDHLIKLEQNRKASFGEIDAACDRLLVSVESCRTHLKELVQEKSDSISADVCKRKDELNYKRGLIASHCSLFKRIQHSASCFSLVTMGPQLNKRINDLDVCKTLPLDCNPPTTLKLTINGNALSRIEMELERLGELKMYNDGNTHSTIDMELAKLGEVTLNSCSVEKQVIFILRI